MSIIYYPKSASLLTREVVGTDYIEQFLDVMPNSIFFFDSGSNFTSSIVELNATTAISASIASTASYLPLNTYQITASYALNSPMATSVPSSSFASSSISSSYSLNAGTAYAINFQPTNARSSSYASSSVSSSYSLTSSYSLNAGSTLTGTNNYFPIWNNNTLTATSMLYQTQSKIGIGTTLSYPSSKRMSMFAFNLGLTESESNLLFLATQKCRQNIGGGWI